jgi:four helix bundle protein
MAKLEKFEDLMAWQKARELSQAIQEATREGGWSSDGRLTDQIRAAAVTVMTHVADSFGRWDRTEELALLTDAIAAAMEVRCCLYVALDAGNIDGKTFEDLRVKAESVSRLVGGWRACKRKGRSGNRSSGNGSDYGGGRSEESERDGRRPAYQEHQ